MLNTLGHEIEHLMKVKPDVEWVKAPPIMQYVDKIETLKSVSNHLLSGGTGGELIPNVKGLIWEAQKERVPVLSLVEQLVDEYFVEYVPEINNPNYPSNLLDRQQVSLIRQDTVNKIFQKLKSIHPNAQP